MIISRENLGVEKFEIAIKLKVGKPTKILAKQNVALSTGIINAL